ncbi:phasin family protein [Piscirickettsia litoralis]|uniref:Phasin family protein n=1 Tax=Piscirickettsia litoralis TaxID=1891921 RepID=A0ABX3A1Y0_9GAMM|nr:phasin family protein [Piscirickettsia litoralis]ODN42881.1 phasin family protein [Piscirickettsia litoralis]
MYQEFFSQWNEKAKNGFTPLIELNQFFTRTTERVMRQNIEITNDFFNNNVEQLSALKDVKSAEDFITLQSKAVNNVNTKIQNTTQQALDLFSTTAKEYQVWLEKYGFEPLNKAQTLQPVETKTTSKSNSKKTAA